MAMTIAQMLTYNPKMPGALPPPPPPKPPAANPTKIPYNNGFYAGAYNPARPVINPSQGPSQAEIEANQRAVAAAAEAQRKLLAKQAKQREVTQKTDIRKLLLTAQVEAGRNKFSILNLAKSKGVPYKQTQADKDAEQIRLDAYNRALQLVQDQTKIGNQNIAQSAWDKLTFGADRRQTQARAFAAQQLETVTNKKISAYSGKLLELKAQQAQRKSAIEKARYSTQAEFDAAVAGYEKWESDYIKKLERERMTIQGEIDAFTKASQAPLTSSAGRLAAQATSNVSKIVAPVLGNVLKYTIGQGSENVPSLATVIPRAWNFLGNINTNDRTIYQSGGETMNRLESGKNAWQATFNQRNSNLKPVVDKIYDKKTAWAELSNGKIKQLGAQQALQAKFAKAKTAAEKDEIARKYWEEKNRSARNQNTAQEFFAEPTALLSGIASAVKKLGWAEKATEVGRATKATSWAFNAADKASEIKSLTSAALKNNKVIKWLGSEAKSPAQMLDDARVLAHDTQGRVQSKFFDQINDLNHKIAQAGGKKIDISIFDDLKRLTDSEAAILQRTIAGKLSKRDRLVLMGNNLKPLREKIEDIAQRYTQFTEDLKLNYEKIEGKKLATRFGQDKRLYSPNSFYGRQAEDMSQYKFWLKKRGKRVQSANNFLTGVTDRYFASDLENELAEKSGKKVAKWTDQRNALRAQYEEALAPSRQLVERAEKRANSPLSKIRSIVGAPTRLWKKSVLKYNPAWSVNNALYNTSATGIVAGKEGFTEALKMLRPKNWRQAMDESRHVFGGNLGREIGTTSRLDKFYNGLEDWSRVAAGRGALKKGLTEEEALKKVNRYFGDFKIKNWERPIKAAVPFYSFQKTIGKAAFRLPFDSPIAAKGLNKLDRYQTTSYDNEFDKMIPELKKLGYTDQEINDFKEDQRKYFKDRLKLGNKWYTTPFNPWSQKKFERLNINPFLGAAGEIASGKDHFGNDIDGKASSIPQRLISKFPQAQLVQNAWRARQISKGLSKPTRSWIGEPGSEGFGLPKEKQGYDQNAKNYDKKLDPRAKLGADIGSFFGSPSSLTFDSKKFLEGKKLNKATKEYFSTKWSDDYETKVAQQAKFFKKYKLSETEFYDGILNKYDNKASTTIKNLKKEAAEKNKKLYEEYHAQPLGTRSVWATNKLRELNKNGYFDKNPYLTSFKWLNPTTIGKADKKQAYDEAKRTGDWTAYNRQYGDNRRSSPYQYDGKFFKTAESMARYKANKERARFVVDGKYFKSQESMDRYLEANSPKSVFWRNYMASDKAGRKKLLAENPEYNDRLNWTAEQWDEYNAKKKAEDRAKMRLWGGGSVGAGIDAHILTEKAKAAAFLNKRLVARRTPSVKWSLSR